MWRSRMFGTKVENKHFANHVTSLIVLMCATGLVPSLLSLLHRDLIGLDPMWAMTVAAGYMTLVIIMLQSWPSSSRWLEYHMIRVTHCGHEPNDPILLKWRY